MKIPELTEKLTAMAKRARFVSLTYRSKSSGELARHTLIIGADYKRVNEDTLLELELQLPELSGVPKIACEELIASVQNTLSNMAKGLGENDNYTKKGMYIPICTGLKLLETDNTVEIQGLAHSKVVLEEGVYKAVKSSEKTIAKGKLRAQTRLGKLRTFAVDLNVLETAKIDGEEIIFP